MQIKINNPAFSHASEGFEMNKTEGVYLKSKTVKTTLTHCIPLFISVA